MRFSRLSLLLACLSRYGSWITSSPREGTSDSSGGSPILTREIPDLTKTPSLLDEIASLVMYVVAAAVVVAVVGSQRLERMHR